MICDNLPKINLLILKKLTIVKSEMTNYNKNYENLRKYEGRRNEKEM